MRSAAAVVEALASALDSDDYEAAAATLAEDVVYRIGDRVLRGPDEVVASYREASEMARGLFDEVGYDHEVHTTEDPDIYRVRYSDVLTVGGETMTHWAEQRITVADGDGVVVIVDVEVAGERERVDQFLARHGLSR